jgi:hypothetical protein
MAEPDATEKPDAVLNPPAPPPPARPAEFPTPPPPPAPATTKYSTVGVTDVNAFTTFHAPFAYISNAFVVVFKRIMALEGDPGRSAVVPVGILK